MNATYQSFQTGQKQQIPLASDVQPGQVFLPAMTRLYRIELNEHDLGQLLDGLASREESWRRTAEYLKTGELPDGEFFLIDECSDETEAVRLADHYDSILKKVQSQMQEEG